MFNMVQHDSNPISDLFSCDNTITFTGVVTSIALALRCMTYVSIRNYGYLVAPIYKHMIWYGSPEATTRLLAGMTNFSSKVNFNCFHNPP